MSPYRVLFPLGLIAALLGASAWISFGFNLTLDYPGRFHPDLMIGGFLASFASGFLMTAIPKFTQTAHARLFEVIAACVALVLVFMSSFLESRIYVHLLSSAVFMLIAIFAAKRVRLRKTQLPKFFLLVGLGIAMGIFGPILLALNEFGILPNALGQFGRLIFTQGAILALMMGVGVKLLPALMGWAPPPDEVNSSEIQDIQSKKYLAPALVASVFTIGFAIEVAGHAQLGYLTRALAVSYIALAHWKIWRRPKSNGPHAFWLWLSTLSVSLGVWAPALWPAHAVDGLHLVFIAGFGLMILMVATRVTLAHGGHGLDLEKKSKILSVVAWLLLLSTATRVIAIMMPKTYNHHLAYAALIWCVAILLWASVFLPKILKVKPTSFTKD